ncbi:acyl-CoA dehydrogenase [Legionella maioricensis]|uniref:Acyl-CoA dehydrogenase n=1 Tax=Legionella maioricensis TaxID=2896528 RepID=A0A9X2D167_9GAMM|nr:acyl-CoA dehydrogenase [Legionella maioricensis]MCL9684715.1 acyl-CoA dehydrogenase [Legionella maioricensis]MCL9687743.1 acyl-CoA dehydrogenase [Legionella maioricensis]
MPSLDDLLLLTGSFEAYLGNPAKQNTPVNFQESLIDDEQESLPWSQLKYIQQWGYMDYLIPVHAGGKLSSLVNIHFLTKSIARRDITTAIAIGLAFFAALPVWIAGTVEQKEQLGKRLRQGEIGALALTEEEHGTDLTANEMVAIPVEDGWELTGRKWCVNFATHGQTTSVLCRTHEKGGLLGFSLFFIDRALAGDHYQPIPKLPTHGVRGLDISGFILNKLHVPKEALIGKEQRGLDITYKVFQISRTLCACLSLGGADTALRLALSFSLKRHLYGKTAYEIPAVKQRLGELFVQLLIADCTSLAVIRACSVMPEKMSFWSAIIKFLIPKIAEDVVEQCAIIIGARAYLRTTEWATLQKIRRDIQVIGLFDGSSQVNLALIAGNLLPQASMRGTKSSQDLKKLEQIFNMNQDCPDFDAEQLRLFTHEEDDILAGLSEINSEPIDHLVALIREEMVRLDQQLVHLKERKLFDPRGLTAFRLAERYCWIFAASCCLHIWFYNQDSLGEELKSTTWLNLAIQLILDKLHVNHPVDAAMQEIMAEHLCTFHQQNKLFSVIPTKIEG